MAGPMATWNAMAQNRRSPVAYDPEYYRRQHAAGQQFLGPYAPTMAQIVPADALPVVNYGGVTADEAGVDTRAPVPDLTAQHRQQLNAEQLAVLDGDPRISPRRNAPPLRKEDENPYFLALTAYHRAMHDADPNYNKDADPIYKHYHDNWQKSLRKGAGVVSIVPPPAAPAPPPAAPAAPVEGVTVAPQPVSWAEPRRVPQYGPVAGVNTQLTRLPCADGRCGPEYNGREAVITNPRMSILGAFALADILKDGNANVNAANQHYDQMAVQMYANDPTFQRDIALGVQRGLTPEAAYHAAVALRGYASGNNNLANATYTQRVLPDEIRNAELQINMADSYGVPYQAQPGVLGDVLPLGGVYSITPNADGTRNFETPNFGFFNAPRDAASQYSQLNKSPDPIKESLGIQKGEDEAAYAQQQEIFKGEHAGQKAAANASGDYLQSVIDRYVTGGAGGKTSKTIQAIAGKSPKEMTPKDYAQMEVYLQRAYGQKLKNDNYAAAAEIRTALDQLKIQKMQLEIEKTQAEIEQSRAGAAGPAGAVLP